MSDSSGIQDTVVADLNPTGDGPDRGPQPAPVPDRPADRAPTGKWVDYVVALGADRQFVTAETRHWNGEEYEASPALRRDDLIELADRLGG
jgi:hypothetical protein